MNYKLFSNETLFTMLQENMLAMSGAMTSMIGEAPIPDIRVIAPLMKTMSFDQFIEEFKATKDITVQTMDIQEMVAEITKESVEIQRELLRRY